MSAEEIARALYEQMVARGYPFCGVELVEDVEGFPRVELWWDEKQVQVVIVCFAEWEQSAAAGKVAAAVAAEIEAEGNGACMQGICWRVDHSIPRGSWSFMMMGASN